ncbi:argininosuccinate lyase [Bartonella rattimassiliensis 15908]|uniref:Argininosuccinate lyase n=1 Tax=Bartonella rattimassiliensis 15908 TaxID=1094556 RepID=J0ZG92_9HYPH|nr:argininosuccinate lyase [Bartonella rattimassiliensis 15908]
MLIGLLTVMKELLLAYSKDMQEDKDYNRFLSLKLSPTTMAWMISDLNVNKRVMKQIADLEYATATDFANWPVCKLTIPFREAHHITEHAVIAARKQCLLQDLSLDELQEIYPDINATLFDVLAVDKSVESHKSLGKDSTFIDSSANYVLKKAFYDSMNDCVLKIKKRAK